MSKHPVVVTAEDAKMAEFFGLPMEIRQDRPGPRGPRAQAPRTVGPWVLKRFNAICWGTSKINGFL